MYDFACRACESHLHIKTADDLQVFLGHVHASRRRERGGQVTTTEIPTLGIAKNLRGVVPDVLEFLQGGRVRNKLFPPVFTSRCGTPSADTLARHRNRLFGIDLLPELIPDELHTMHLGVFQIFVHTVLRDLIICDVWRVSQGMGVQV